MTITKDYILFYGDDWPSNFAPSPITVYDDFWEKGLFGDEPYFPPTVTFKTAEAYYQSRKAVMAKDKDRYYKIANASTPAETKKIAREIKLDSKKWDTLRIKYMRETLKLKFDQNKDLKVKILDPKLEDKLFIEASPWDGFWGAKRSERELIREIEEKGHIELRKIGIEPAFNSLGYLLNEYRDKNLI